ncbi:DUF4245 domain-containing protein [Corynebacterium sp. HMSC28B08]|uniref:DUF4245 domain-containing protein n=1 Tax=Corynebacterium TaxID=1716 RepID=UPI0008A59007|nr:DUF4245 domain-containing protein [Corynebacterium sp. HMSC28B08]OFT88597.1 hypothetical protein HMPREF3098_07960 [Corynebacterium sp. HMSC28B08]
MGAVQIQKPRVFQSTKDMILSLGVLLLATFLTVGFTGLCSYNPGGPDKTGPVQEIDAKTALTMDARSLSVPIRYPEMPDNWVPNSARRTSVGQEPSSLVGWVIDGEKYISLTQTKADMKTVMKPKDDPREETEKKQISGVEWTVLRGEDARPLWVADRGDVRWMIEYMGQDADAQQLAEQLVKTDPIKK